jgi:8-oxo-dGTP diphosphatase
MRREKAWVLPKGKLMPREHPRDAAKREVLEETGHEVSVHKFLGSMAYPALGRIKIVQFWLMRASSLPERELSNDVKAVKWLPLRQAIETLSRPHEKVFLTHVGPIALNEIKKTTRKKTRSAKKRRSPGTPATPHVIAMDYEKTRPSAFAKALGKWFGRTGQTGLRKAG